MDLRKIILSTAAAFSLLSGDSKDLNSANSYQPHSSDNSFRVDYNIEGSFLGMVNIVNNKEAFIEGYQYSDKHHILRGKVNLDVVFKKFNLETITKTDEFGRPLKSIGVVRGGKNNMDRGFDSLLNVFYESGLLENREYIGEKVTSLYFEEFNYESGEIMHFGREQEVYGLGATDILTSFINYLNDIENVSDRETKKVFLFGKPRRIEINKEKYKEGYKIKVNFGDSERGSVLEGIKDMELYINGENDVPFPERATAKILGVRLSAEMIN